MEFTPRTRLLITRNKELFDQVHIVRVEETVDGRILHVASTLNFGKGVYKIAEDPVHNYAWRELDGDAVKPPFIALTLEVIP